MSGENPKRIFTLICKAQFMYKHVLFIFNVYSNGRQADQFKYHYLIFDNDND